MGRLATRKIAQYLYKCSGLACFTAIAIIAGFAKAQEQAVFECIQKYTALGVSADAALLQCNQMTIGDCVETLIRERVIITAVRHDPEQGYLIDLGSDEYSWLEGDGWREKGCEPYTEGPYRRNSDNLRGEGILGRGRSFEWFRQGWCEDDKIVLDRLYSLEEANILCQDGKVENKNQEKRQSISLP